MSLRRVEPVVAVRRGARRHTFVSLVLTTSLSLVAALLVGVPAKAAEAVEARVACPEALPDEASASRTAKQCGQPVEVLAGRSEQTQVFANPDGTTTFTATAMPERTRLADGSWTDIDTTLRVREDGWLVPVATLAEVAFSPGGSGPFVTYRDEGSTLTLGLGTGRLPRPKVEGDTATYANVLPGVDLAVSATATGFRHVLVVKTRAAAMGRSLRSISLVVGGDARAQSFDGDRVRFADGRGRTIAITDTAAMWDSAVRPALQGERTAAASPGALAAMKANPGEGLRSSPARAGVTAREAKIGVAAAVDGRSLVLTPDPDFLLDESVVLPIYIDPQVGPGQTKWAYTRSNNVNFNTSDGHARVGRNVADGTLFRAFYEMPTTVPSTGLTWIGKQVLSASVSSRLYHSWSCHPTPAYLYRPQPITVANGGRMGWNDRPLGAGSSPSTVYLGSASGNANKAGGCGVLQPDMVMTWSGAELLADVRLRSQQSASEYTVAICACDNSGNNSDESTQDRWKKFYRSGGTSMSVTFNTVPDAPADLSPHNGQVACGSVVATSSPVLRAQYVDTDDSDTLTATFEYRQVGGSTVSVAGPALVANAYGSVTLNLGAAAEGKQYEFRVRTNDGNADSPWSHPDAGPWCRFTVDTTAPPAPVVEPMASGAAPVYVQCDAADVGSCVAQGGPGEAGGFRFTVPPGPQGQDVTTYVYGWDSTPTTSVSVAPGQPSSTILLTPPRYGLNRIAVFARDGIGKEGPTTVFTFLVGSPAPAAAHWPLSSIDGHDYANLVGGGSLTVSNVELTDHDRYYDAKAATFSAGSASQSVPSFDTAGSFSVAAWVRPDSASCGTDATVVAVDGASSSGSNQVSGFMLGYECATSRWHLTLPATNTADPELATVTSANGSVEAGHWTLLIAGWNEAAGQLWLSVDGVVTTASPSTSWSAARGSGWKATGPVTIGRGRQNGADTAGFTGQIADVRLWNRVLVEQDLTGADADPVNGVLATDRVFAPIPVGEWAFAEDTCLCTYVADGSIFGRWATLVPNWSLDPYFDYDPASAPAWLQGPGHDGNGEVRLDGAGGHVSTADDSGTLDPADDAPKPVLHTDQSLSISVWARTEQSTGADQVVVSAGPIDLMRRDSDGKWAMVMRSGGSVISTAVSDAPAPTGTSAFTHLVGVFDAAANTLTLYVDGVKQTVIGTGATGGDYDTSLTFGSRGTSGHFAGSIDDVRVYQGVLIDREITALYSAV